MIRSAMVRLARRALREPLFRSGALQVLRVASQPMSTIFMLHRFDDSTAAGPDKGGETLREVLEVLRRQRVELIPVSTLVDRMEGHVPITRPTVSFTVDDGYRDFKTVAAPIFSEFDCPVTVFLSTDVISSRSWYWWDQLSFAVHQSPLQSLQLTVDGRVHDFVLGGANERAHPAELIVELVKFASDPERRRISECIGAITDVEVPHQPPEHYRTLTWDEVRELESETVSFGPHSCSHPIFSRIDEAAAHYEIAESWAAMQRECATPAPIFCFPNGTAASFTERDLRLVSQAGLRGAVTYVRDRVTTRSARPMDAFRLPRYELPDDAFDAAWLAAALFSRP